MSGVEALRDGLPPLQRLALSYSPANARLPTLALLALDTRLAGIVRNSREPMLAQLRLAWWRQHLAADTEGWPEGEPLLAALRSWRGLHKPLGALCDGWEQMTGTAPLPSTAFAELAAARGEAFVALADVLRCPGDREEAERLAREWALADIAARVAHPQERSEASQLASGQSWAPGQLDRRMRPLLVLHALARRDLKAAGDERTWRDLAVAMRVGLFGR